MDIILFIIMILPVIAIGYFVYQTDKHKEPFKLLIKLFISGILCCFGVVFLTDLLNHIPLFASNPNHLNPYELFIFIFVGISLVEEICKFIPLYLISYNDKEFDYLFDMIVYSVFVSLGFACFENYLYVISDTIATGILRGLTAIPSHACDGVFMGYFLGLSKIYSKKDKKMKSNINKLLAIIVPTISHGIYDYCIYYNSRTATVLFFISVGITFFIAFSSVKKISEEDVKID